MEDQPSIESGAGLSKTEIYNDAELERIVQQAYTNAFDTASETDTFSEMHGSAVEDELKWELGEDYEEEGPLRERMKEWEMDYLPVVLSIQENEMRKRMGIRIDFGVA